MSNHEALWMSISVSNTGRMISSAGLTNPPGGQKYRIPSSEFRHHSPGSSSSSRRFDPKSIATKEVGVFAKPRFRVQFPWLPRQVNCAAVFIYSLDREEVAIPAAREG